MRKSDITLICRALAMWGIIVGIGFLSTVAFNSLLVALMITAIALGLWCVNKDCIIYCALTE